MNGVSKLLILGLALSGSQACGGPSAPREHTRPALEVTVAPAVAVDAAERLEAGGVVAAPATALVASRMIATVAHVAVTAGDRVRAGDVLVRLDASEVAQRSEQARAIAQSADKSLTQARAELVAAEAEHQLASTSHARIAALHARNSATDQERDDAAARLAVAAARVAGSQAAVDAADATASAARAGVAAAAATESYTTLRAPFDGLITERLVDPGSLAAPGVPLLHLESDGARQVVVRVDEARAAYVHPADVVEVGIDRPRASPDTSETEVEGVVTEVARAVGADQRAFTVKVTLPRTVSARSGTFARVIFRGLPRRTLVVPARAIRRYGQLSSVYVVEHGAARLRLIHEGPLSSAGVEVLAGLEAGELLVVSAPEGLADGATVTVRTAAGAEGATP